MYFTKQFVNKVYTVGLLLVVLLIFLDLITYFYFSDTIFSKIFRATREQTPLTWVSVTAFLLLAFACMSISQRSKPKLWLSLAATFFFFSMDDAVYFHERVSGYLIDNTEILDSFPTYIWIVIYAPLLFFALITLVIYLWYDSSRNFRAYIVTAVFFLGIAMTLDLTDGLMEKNDSIVFCLDQGCHANMIHLIRLTEEVLEVLAIGLLGYLTLKKYCIFKKENVVKRFLNHQ